MPVPFRSFAVVTCYGGGFPRALMCDEVSQQDVELPLPKDWHSVVRNAVLNMIGIVRIAMLAGREALIKNGNIKEDPPVGNRSCHAEGGTAHQR